MFTILIVVFIAYCAYKFFSTPGSNPTQTKEREVGAIKDAVNTFKSDLAPVKEQVTTATANAKKAYTDAQHQRRIDAILGDPKLLADALEARQNTQKQLTAPDSE